MTDDMGRTAVIDEQARRRFEQFWAEGNPHPIEEFLPDETHQEYLPTLEELVLIDLEFAWRTWSSRRSETAQTDGETVIGPPHAETYVTRFSALQRPEVMQRLVLEEIGLRNRFGPPPQPDEYRARFPQIELPDTVFSGLEKPANDTAAGPVGVAANRFAEEILPRQFGAYRLTERIGAGGMGVVYRAWQEGVEREIAVKVLRTDRLADLPADHRQVLIDRFRNEARATARIDHPRIVNVFDVGEADGVPYYTMQYVAGSSLGEGMRSAPLPGREAARIMQVVADAVQNAHDHGILHRDLKPQNIIIEESSGAPYVADFGLAKLLEDNASQTVTGEILGTPLYMAPEQARDAAGVTTRSDVYSLGATLYYLLTGAPPIPGQSHIEILRNLLDKDPRPPRELNPEIDADLEVICLKCLEKEPERRYASAGMLAEDLSCWLAGEPIAARPPGRWERAVRWCRRNPLPGSLAAVTALSLVFGALALGAGYTRATTERDRANEAREDAEASDRNARAAVNDFFTIVSDDVLLNQPGMQPLRRELLERALAHYRDFLEQRQDDPELRAEVAAAHYRVGRIVEDLESLSAALASYEQAAAIQHSLHREQPESSEITSDLSTTRNAMGACLTRLDRADEAMTAFQEALALRQSLVDGDADNVEYHRLLANTVMNIGLCYKTQTQFDQARQQIETSISMRTPLLDAQPRPRNVVRDQGKAYLALANLEIDLAFLVPDGGQRLVRAVGHLDRALELLIPLTAEIPDDFELRLIVIRCFRLLGESRIKQLDFAGAEQAYSPALDRMRELAIENPRVPDYQVELADLLQLRAQHAILRGDRDNALELYVESCRVLTPVVESDRVTPEAKSDLVQALHGLAFVYLERAERSLALEAAEKALEHAEQLVAEDPGNGWYAQQQQDVQQLLDAITAADQ